ncbi:MAG: serine hydrolase domain-containing protein [Acidimicrobiales bacterium]
MSDTAAPPAFAAALQRVVEAEHSIGDEPCILRVEVPALGLVSKHAAGTLQRRADGVEPVPVTPDSPFRVASVTKPFTSVVVAQLVAEGKLSFDDRLADLLPESHLDLVPRMHVLDGVSYGERITMRQALTHASGLFDYAMSPSYGKALFLDPSHVWTPREMVEGAIAWGTPHFPPGEGYGYAYADTGYVLAGVIIEALDGRALWESYRARILDPLGMTGTYLEGFEPHRGPAISHAHEGEFDVMPIHGSSDWAGGGLVSTVDELAVFAQALVDGRAVGEPQLGELLHWQFRTLDPALHSPGYLGYGMGVEARDLGGHVFRGHRGHWGVLMHRDPVSGITITGTINQSSRRPDALADGAVAAITEHLPASVWEAQA